jgi:hypothetical protein
VAQKCLIRRLPVAVTGGPNALQRIGSQGGAEASALTVGAFRAATAIMCEARCAIVAQRITRDESRTTQIVSYLVLVPDGALLFIGSGKTCHCALQRRRSQEQGQ